MGSLILSSTRLNEKVLNWRRAEEPIFGANLTRWDRHLPVWARQLTPSALEGAPSTSAWVSRCPCGLLADICVGLSNGSYLFIDPPPNRHKSIEGRVMTYKHRILTTKQKWNEFVVDYGGPGRHQHRESFRCLIRQTARVESVFDRFMKANSKSLIPVSV